MSRMKVIFNDKLYSFVVDWSHLEIDVEKRTYFTSVYNRYQQQKQKGEPERHISNENNRPKNAWGEK